MCLAIGMLENLFDPLLVLLQQLLENFFSDGEKMRNASGLQGENEWQRKKVNRNTYNKSSVKCVTRTFLEVSRCSRAKQRQGNVQKKCAAHAKFLFFC